MIKLDVCCGHGKKAGYIGLDKRCLPGVDIVHDINMFPWPLEDDGCCSIFMTLSWSIIEPKFRIAVMDEMWRILHVDGELQIFDVYYRSPCAAHDPMSYSCANEWTFKYFDPVYEKYLTYEPKPWRLVDYAYNERELVKVKMVPRKEILR